MAGTFTNIDIGYKTFNMNSGKHAEMHYDMVKLNLGSSNYVTAPYITVDDSLWVADNLNGTYRIVCTSTTAEAGWSWYENGEYKANATEAQLQAAFGLTINYPTTTPAMTKAIGDEINITKRVEYEGNYSVTASYTRRGAVLEVDCPLLRNTIPTSPYVGVDTAKWSNPDLDYGEWVFDYTETSGQKMWGCTVNGVRLDIYYADVALLGYFGITIYYPDENSYKTLGDKITICKTDNQGQIKMDYIYTQTGDIAPAQKLANEILIAVQDLGYQPLYANNAIINPAAEIGDSLTVCGVKSGLYHQETTFNRLMSSNVGAPSSSEADPEMDYETKQERNYARKFADIASELNIQASQISAKVSRASPAGQTSFSWELFDDHFSVLCNGNHMLYIDQSGSQFAGQVMANQIVVDKLTVGGQEIPAGWIQGSASGEYNQIALESLGGGFGGNIALDEMGIALNNVVGGIKQSLGFADFSDSVFKGYGEGAPTLYTWGIQDAATGAAFTKKYIYYKDHQGQNATMLVWGNTD